MPPRQSKALPVYQRPSSHQCLTAANKNPKTASIPSPETYPGPVVLPGDCLDDDPRYPPQSFRSWRRDKDRNEVTKERGVIYVVPPPEVKEEVRFMTGWTRPAGEGEKAQEKSVGATSDNKGGPRARAQSKRKRISSPPIATGTPHPKMNDVVDYLAAFYHHMPVKLLPSSTLTFSAWTEDSKAKSRSKHTSRNPRYLALDTPTESIRIRTRLAPSSSTDSELGPLFSHQLSLDDLLDAALSILPSDAYAILCLVAHDIYESEDDDFACGRAYGASRIAVVSMARYDPGLDEVQGLDEIHPWPASHFGEHGTTDAILPPATKKRKNATAPKVAGTSTAIFGDLSQESSSQALTPLRAAFAHHTPTPHPSSLYLFRICRTASHELGHCFGMDHCVYYACSMQGTTSLAEDMRQPPYLCPVDLAKVIIATSTGPYSAERTETERMRKRYEAMIRVCERFARKFGEGSEEGQGPWKAFGAWLEGRVQELNNEY